MNVGFRGLVGYKNYVGYLNTIASHYETSGVTVGSRHFGYSNQTEIISSDTYFVNPAPWTCATGGSCSPDPDDYEAYGGGDTGYLDDYDLVNTVLGKREANKVGTSVSSEYCMASRYYSYAGVNTYGWYARIVSTGTVYNKELYYYSLYNSDLTFITSNSYCSVRPIVTLSANLTYSGLGTKDFPMEIAS